MFYIPVQLNTTPKLPPTSTSERTFLQSVFLFQPPRTISRRALSLSISANLNSQFEEVAICRFVNLGLPFNKILILLFQVPGAANTDGGVLIALSAFTNITIAADHKSVQAGPALNWYDLYSALEPYGLIAIGGRLKTIGIAGLSIGGGISYFSAKYGFAMDNIIAYDVVLASGQVVTATATSHSDLFWALKGGGSNFGIVTKFTFATYEAPLVSTMIGYFGEPTVPEFIQAVYDLAIYQDQVDTGAGGVFYVGYAAATGMQPLTLAAQIGNETKPAVFENFTAIPSEFSSYNVMTLAQWTGSLDTPFQASR